MPWINRLLQYVGPFFGKSILNKLICKFDRVENSFSLVCKYTLMEIIDMNYHQSIPICFIFIFTSRIAFI